MLLCFAELRGCSYLLFANIGDGRGERRILGLNLHTKSRVRSTAFTAGVSILHIRMTESGPFSDMPTRRSGVRAPTEELVPVTESYCRACLGHRLSICLRNSLRILEVTFLVIPSLILAALAIGTSWSRISGVRQARYSLLWQAGSAKCPGWARRYWKQLKQAGLLHPMYGSSSRKSNCLQ
jgi:hypothetical protein